MPDMFQTASSNSVARRFAISACHARYRDATALVDTGVRFWRDCWEANMPREYVYDSLVDFRTQMQNLVHGIDRDLDEEGQWPSGGVSFTELDELIGRLA